jgi:2-keto-4-pentenoate hydratase/2-oxohepta-3-ene-1,7-dioic acid hydratase in catechol pathway
MRIATVDDRLCLGTDRGWADVAASSGGQFEADPQAVYERWAEFSRWASSYSPAAGPSLVTGELGAPAPRPRQAFGAGLNYADHAGESGLELPAAPLIFAKYASCISGPADPLVISTGSIDWEVELVAVIGARSRHVPASEAWAAVAGLTIGQDISDRTLQWSGGATPQFSLGKSGPGFGPTGPVLVTPDELADRDDLAIECRLNGEVVQSSRTRHLIFGVPALVAYLSSHVTLLPGDLIFTGTPAGVGMARTPPRYLTDGDELVSTIEGIGEFITRVTK